MRVHKETEGVREKCARAFTMDPMGKKTGEAG